MPKESNLYHSTSANRAVNKTIFTAAATGLAGGVFALLILPGISLVAALAGGIIVAALTLISNVFWGLSSYQSKQQHHHHHHHHDKKLDESQINQVQEKAESKIKKNEWRKKTLKDNPAQQSRS